MEGLSINSLDLAVGAALIVSALLAFIRGFVHELLSIAAWAGALAASIYGLPYVRPFAHSLISIGWAADAAAAVVIFLAVLLALSLATHAVSRTIQKSALNNLDRSLGFVFGLARAVVVLGIGLIVVDWLTDRDRPGWIRTAKTLPIIEQAADGIKLLVPSSLLAPSALARDDARANKAASETRKTLDRLTTPAAAREAKDENDAGYRNKERREMEQLLNSSETVSPEPEAQAAPEKTNE